ncbi:MAG: TrkH family potassium uptake protein [Oscillospiraceae bacterium]|nr:TrkH family potassium uptake protein [Oscillospiraceae bacterium]
MNYKMTGKFISQIITIEALFMLPPLLISAFCRETGAMLGFLYTIGITLALAGILFLLCRKAGRLFSARDGLICVGLGWIALSLLGCLPFVFSREIPRFIDAFFETVSGFTTTGASVVADIESMSKGLVYWRSFSHWLGGMGVLVFLLAVAPSEGGEKGFTLHLMRAESPGPDVGKLVPKMRQTATILYLIYIVLTVLNVVFLLMGGMGFFEALCTAFGTAGTGGFGIRNDSLASYSPYIQNVTTVFMLLFGINFSCFYLLLLGKIKNIFRDEELRLYLGLFIGCSVAIAANIFTQMRQIYPTAGEALRHAAFQVSSIMTTTGFATTDFDLWPGISKALLLLLMVIGACAGSTGGGIKCARVLLLFKSLRRNTRQLLDPRKVQVIRSGGKTVDERVVSNTNAYLAAYVIIVILSFLLVSLDRFSLETNLSAVLACFNNIGPGLASVGPACNYSGYSDFSKLILSIDMLSGRLEIFPILVLLSRNSWRKR